jgi:hypothetical protein
MSNIPINFLINDDRSIKDFRDKTFSSYKKKDVLNIFQKSIMSDNIEDSCYWGCELLISGHIQDIWNTIFSVYFKVVNIKNPKFIEKIFNRYIFYLKIKKQYTNQIDLRNNQSIRNYISEIICILCKSSKNKPIKFSKIDNKQFDIKFLTSKFTATQNFVKEIIRENDPQELNIILNEFYHNLFHKKFEESLYWFNWCLEWDKINSKKKNKIKLSSRKISGIDTKYCGDLLWIFWEIILDYIKRLKIDFFTININYLYTLFKLNYIIINKTKNLWLIVCAISFLTKSYNLDIKIIDEYKYIIQATGNINFLFLNFKEHEICKDPNHFQKLQALNSKIINNKNTVEPKKTKEQKNSKNPVENKSNQKFNKLLEIDKVFLSNNSKETITKNNITQKVVSSFNKSKQSTASIIKEIDTLTKN